MNKHILKEFEVKEQLELGLCTYDVSVLLYDLGFKDYCEYYHDTLDKDHKVVKRCCWRDCFGFKFYPCPYLFQAQKFLREQWSTQVEAKYESMMSADKSCGMKYWTWERTNLLDTHPQQHTPVPTSDTMFMTYERALDAGLFDVLTEIKDVNTLIPEPDSVKES